jgi:transposase-like protein
MATLEKYQNSGLQRETRYFSEEFRKRKVLEIESRLISIAEICRQYGVSATAVYKWIYKYSVMRKKGIKVVVESDSDTARIKALQDHVSELEKLLGQKQFELEFLEKQIQIASEKYGVDLKKKPSGPPFSGTGKTKSNTPTK